MKNLVVGIAMGVGLACLYKKMEKDGYMDKNSEELNRFISGAKKKIKEMFDSSKNQADYLKDRAQYEVDKGKEKLNDIVY